MMMRARQTLLRISLVATLAFGFLTADGLQSPNVTSAQSVQVSGPLAGAPAVMDQRLWRDKRLHIEPFFAFTIADEYSRSLIVGGELRFHFTDWLGLGVGGGYSVAQLDTNLTKEVQSKGVTTNANRLDLPSRENYPSQVGRIDWWTGVEMHFIPFRGKLAMFQKVFVDADIDLFVGAAFIGLEERANVVGQPASGNVTFCQIEGGNQDDTGCLESQTTRSSRVRVAPSFGAAFTAFFKEFVGIAFRWRGIPFKYNTSGTDNNGDGAIDSGDRIRQFNNMFTVGVIFALPPDTR
jgi:hypothetical protein